MLRESSDQIPTMPTVRATDGFAVTRPKTHLDTIAFVTVHEGKQYYSLADIDRAKEIHRYLGELIEKAEAHVREVSDS